jgi:hypothetical protein
LFSNPTNKDALICFSALLKTITIHGNGTSYFIFRIASLFQELQQLGETIGTESKGLPEDMIALLKSSTYKIRIFSRKEKYDEYVLEPIR